MLLVTHLNPGGAQETVVLLADGLDKLGFDVTVVAAPGGTEEPRLGELGIPVLTVPGLQRRVSPRADSTAYRQLRRLLRGGSFDIVHTHSSKAGVLGRLAARREGVAGILHTSHGLPVNPDMSRLEKAILLTAERIAARASHRIVAVSRATAQELVDLKLARPNQLAVISSGIDVDRFRRQDKLEAKRALGLPEDAPVAGWIGRHFEQKRPGDVVSAARSICERVPGAYVLLVGDGPLLEASRKAAEDCERVRVLGFRADVEMIYAALDVMYLASAWEGLPRTILEAMAAGAPVVSTDVSGVSEVVEDGTTGFLVDVGDWRTLTDRVARILNDPALAGRMSQAAAAKITREYSAQHTVEATAELYERLLQSPTESART